MLALQFEVHCGHYICDQFYIYRPEKGHSVDRKDEEIVFSESGFLNPELYCKKLKFVKSFEKNYVPFESTNLERNMFKLHKGQCTICRDEMRDGKFRRSIHLDGYCISAFFSLLRMSNVYPKLVLNFHYGVLSKKPEKSGLTEIHIYQDQPKKHPLDYAGNKIFEFLVHQRIELEHAMSWLSTLGGAFSALGDNQIHCAVVAGRISVQQFRIAMELGDEITVIRCILYYGMSLVQRGQLKQAKKVIEHQYNMAKMMPCVDKRILSMCHGIWARLKYEYEKRRCLKIRSVNYM